jgi:ribosomal protein S28E/S33
MKTNQANDADVIAVIGATGSGKGVFIKNHELKKSEQRIVFWDYMREYGPLSDLQTATLGTALESMRAARFRTAFQPSFDDKVRAKQFDVFCKAAVAVGNLRLVAEELAFVTSPSHAPAGWKMATSIGRHKGLRIIGASQRPAQVDKAFWSNCTEIHCGFLNYEDDRKTMARALGVTVADIQALKPLEFIHKNVRTKEINFGKVKVP